MKKGSPKRFLAFGFDNYYPTGGWNDFQGSSDSLEQAAKLVRKHELGHIVDGATGEVWDVSELSSMLEGTRRAKTKPTPILDVLLKQGSILIEGNTYVGIASDGTSVQFGQRGDEQSIERYLLDHREPTSW